MTVLQLLSRLALRPVGVNSGGRARPHMSHSLKTYLREPEPMIVSAGVALGIENTVGRFPAEQGGVLGGRPGGPVERFHFDGSADRTGSTYSPDVASVNRLIEQRWNPRGLRFKGFVHSHPVGFVRPSHGDEIYASRILSAIKDLDELLIPIAQSAGDGAPYSLRGFRAVRRDHRVRIEGLATVRLPKSTADPYEKPMFDRVVAAYDLNAMSSTRLVVVGVGGAAAFIEEMARSGIGEIVLIDPDRIEMPNLATQQVYRSDIGKTKVGAVAKRIRDINPDCKVWTLDQSSDALSDVDFHRLIRRYLPGSDRAQPELTILCGFTDSFPAQARVNRLALEFGVPMLAAQVYLEGRGAEVTFSAPGVTAACGRCVVGGRYRAYLEQGFQNDVGSAGTPLLATTRLNATKAAVAMAMIHGTHPRADAGHPATARWAGLLDRIASQNLVQIRLDPQVQASLGLTVFDRVFGGADLSRIVTDETLWLPQEPESPSTGFAACPDCGGSGDLRSRIGSVGDTSQIPLEWNGAQP